MAYWWEAYPWTNLHDLNLDWVIEVCQNALKDEEGFNTQISNLQTQISNLQTQIDEANEDIQTQIDEANGDIQTQIDEANGDIQKIQDYLSSNQFINENLDELKKWIDENIIEVVSAFVKYVFFGLTDDGHFAAYIPHTWDSITFDTGFDVNNKETFGRLLLKY